MSRPMREMAMSMAAALGGTAVLLSSIHKIRRGWPIARIQGAACLVTSRPTAMTTQSCSRRCCVTTSLRPRSAGIKFRTLMPIR